MLKVLSFLLFGFSAAVGANAFTLSTHVSHLELAAQDAKPWTESGAAVHFKEKLPSGVKQLGASISEHNRYGLRAQEVQAYAVAEFSPDSALELSLKSGFGAEYLARAGAALTVYKALSFGVEGTATYAQNRYANSSTRTLGVTLAKEIDAWQVELGHSQELEANSSVQKVKVQYNFYGKKLSLAYYVGDEMDRVPLQAPKLLPIEAAVFGYIHPASKNLDVILSWQRHWKTQARSGLLVSLTYAFE